MTTAIKIYIGADHRGFKTKQRLIAYLKEYCQGIEVIDLGAYDYDHSDDFNDPAINVATKVTEDLTHSYGILICGSSFGVCMQANRFPHIRAINPLTPESTQVGRRHNAANVLCLSADQLEFAQITTLVKIFLQTNPADEPRFRRRNQRLDEIYSE